MEILKPESNTDVRLFPTAGKDGEEEETSDDYSFTVVHSESKARSDAVNLEPAVVIEPEPGEAEHDGDLDALDMNSEEHDSVDQDALPYPLAFLAVESKSEDGMWEPAANVKVESDAQNEDFGVRLEELGEVSNEAWEGYMRIRTRRSGQAAKYQDYKTDEELERTRERNRLYMRKFRASQSMDEVEKRREKGRMYKRLAVMKMSTEEAAQQREQNRIYMQRLRASQTPEEVEKRREKGRMYKKLSTLRQTPEEAERKREQNRLYMRKLRASQTPEEVERRKEKNRMYKRLSVLRRSSEEAERQREQNRLYMRQLRAAKKGLKLDAQNTGGNMQDRFYMKGFEEMTRENMRKTRQSVRQEIVQSCSAQDIEQHFRIAAEARMQDGQHLEEAASHLMGKQHSLFIDRVEKQLGGMQTIEQVEREISRQLWQKTGFWDYLALLNKPQSDGKVLKTFEACDDDRASAKNY